MRATAPQPELRPNKRSNRSFALHRQPCRLNAAPDRPYNARGAQGYRTPGKPRQRAMALMRRDRGLVPRVWTSAAPNFAQEFSFSRSRHKCEHINCTALNYLKVLAQCSPSRRKCCAPRLNRVCSRAHLSDDIAHETCGCSSTSDPAPHPIREKRNPASLGRNASRERETAHLSRHRPPPGRPNGRPMTGSGGRSSIPETSVIEPISRSVLDTPPSRGMTVRCGVGISTSLRAERSNPFYGIKDGWSEAIPIAS